MKKIRLILVGLLLADLIYCSVPYAEAAVYAPTFQLKQEADLIIVGEVIKVEQAGKTQEIHGIVGQTNLATIKIDRILKGATDSPTVIVEFVKLIPGMEADTQDAQFAVRNRGTTYLKKLPNGNYKALGGWLKGWDKGKWF